MKVSISNRVVQSLQQAVRHNSNIMVKPEVILWPDPERQWEPVIHQLQEKLESLLVYGSYEPEKRQGPVIWLKCMVARVLPEADWPETATPIIYLPGISRQDFKNITAADLLLQPLMEYQYTGTMWLQENGKEWAVSAFVQNTSAGMGMKMAQDSATKEALLTVLPRIFNEPDVFSNTDLINADYLLSLVYPDIISNILKWMEEGDVFLNSLSPEKKSIFINLCKTHYEFEPDYRNIKDITLKLGSRKNAWAQVWQYFANAPAKYPKIPELLRLSKPADLGFGMFALPEDSWPQVNKQKEEQLRDALQNISKIKISDVPLRLDQLLKNNQNRKNTVWHELGLAPLADALAYLTEMARTCSQPYPSATLQEMATYYANEGFKADLMMRKALAAASTVKDVEAVTIVISYIFKPWLENISKKFQTLLEKECSVITSQKAAEESEEFVLFVDALRYELAFDFSDRLRKAGFEVDLQYRWTALPTITATSKPYNSPVSGLVSADSICDEFRPQLLSGKALHSPVFRDALVQKDFHFVSSISEIDTSRKIWMEIGNIDTKGHHEQSGIVHRIDDLYRSFLEIVEAALLKGVKVIKVVTDHGWLLLPGGLPKTELSKHLTETRWGRCALIKEGASTDLLHLPWKWNPSVFIAYAPGISFFKNNVAYAHGGISLQECLIPIIVIQEKKNNVLSGKIRDIKWNNLICKVELDGANDEYQVDIRTKPLDETTTIVISPTEKKIVKENMCSLMVDDTCEGMAVWIVLSSSTAIIVDKQMTSVGQ